MTSNYIETRTSITITLEKQFSFSVINYNVIYFLCCTLCTNKTLLLLKVYSFFFLSVSLSSKVLSSSSNSHNLVYCLVAHTNIWSALREGGGVQIIYGT